VCLGKFIHRTRQGTKEELPSMLPNSPGSAGLAQPHVSRSLDAVMSTPPVRNGATHTTLL
jgi:hypothetical protein